MPKIVASLTLAISPSARPLPKPASPLDLDRVAQILGGVRIGDSVYAPAPGSGPGDRSLVVQPNASAPHAHVRFDRRRGATDASRMAGSPRARGGASICRRRAISREVTTMAGVGFFTIDQITEQSNV
jgi:hypothetical protein